MLQKELLIILLKCIVAVIVFLFLSNQFSDDFLQQRANYVKEKTYTLTKEEFGDLSNKKTSWSLKIIDVKNSELPKTIPPLQEKSLSIEKLVEAPTEFESDKMENVANEKSPPLTTSSYHSEHIDSEAYKKEYELRRAADIERTRQSAAEAKLKLEEKFGKHKQKTSSLEESLIRIEAEHKARMEEIEAEYAARMKLFDAIWQHYEK